MKVKRVIERFRSWEKDGVLYLSFYRNGRRYRMRAETAAELATGGTEPNDPTRPARPVGGVMLTEAVESYWRDSTSGIVNRRGRPKCRNQAAKDKFVLGRIVKRLAGRRLSSVTRQDLEDYILDRSREVIPRRNTNPTVATLNRDKAVIKGFFTYCNQSGLCDSNPASTLKMKKENNMRLGWAATDEELLRWSRQLGHHQLAQDIFMTLVNTGLRLEEVLRLKTEDYKRVEDGAKLFIRTSKGEEPSFAWVNKPLREILDRRVKLGGEWLFATAKGTPYSQSGIRGVLSRARDRAGLRKFRLHDLRRSAATILCERSKSVPRAKELLHHKSIETTMRYIGVRDGQGREAVEVLNDMDVNKGYSRKTFD